MKIYAKTALEPKLRLSFLSALIRVCLLLLVLSASAFCQYQCPTCLATFTYQIGGTVPTSEQWQVTTSAGSLAITVDSGGASWITASLNSNVTTSSVPAILTIGLNSAGLANLPVGTYNDTVTVSTVSEGSEIWTITLDVIAASAPGSLTLSATSLSFTAVAGGSTPANQTLTVTAQSSTSATAAVSEQSCTAESWLSLSPLGTFTAGTTATNFTVSVNQSGITAGTQCSGTIAMTTSAGTQNVSVTLNVTSASTGPLTFNPSSLTFTAAANGSAPATQTLAVTAQTSTSATASTSEQSCTGETWLSISPTGTFTAGTTATNFTVSVTQAGIASGTTCTGTISMATAAGTQTVTVTLNVTTSAALPLTLSPSSFAFNAAYGGAAPATQTLTVTAQTSISAVAQFSEQTCASNNWLSLVPTGNFTASQNATTFAVAVNPTGISAGTQCTGTISMITSAGTQTASVTLNVTVFTSAPPLTMSASAFTFTALAGGATPPTQTLSVTAQTSASVTAQATEQGCTSSNWLTISPTGSFTASTTASTFTISVTQSGIQAGTACNGTIALATANATQNVYVTMVVTSSTTSPGTPGNVTATPAGPLSFSFTIGGSNPPAQNVSVTSSQTSESVNFAVATSASWLTTSAGSYTVSTPYTLQIIANPANLVASATPYAGTVTITPTGGTAVIINVTLTVISVPVISATPTTLSFTYAAGGPNPATQTVQISAGGSAATFTVATSSSGWLQVSSTCTSAAPCTTPNTGTFNLTVTANPAGVNVGTYNGSIAVSGVGQATGTTMVNVSLAVTAVTPSITLVTNGASFLTGPVSPGEIVSIFANASTPIGPATAVQLNSTTCPSPCTNIPTAMGGVQVMFQPAGVAAPLLYISSTQVTCIVPYEIQQGSIQVTVSYLGQASAVYLLQYAATEPGIFTATPNGSGLAAALQYDAKGNYQGQNSSSNPASPGWYLTFYVTGEGIIPAPAVDGQVTSSTAVVPLLGPPFVMIDNLPSTVTYFAEADGTVSGVMQVNAIVPAAVHTGRAVSLSLSMNGTGSQSGVTIYIR